jgi:hypothetical protein
METKKRYRLDVTALLAKVQQNLILENPDDNDLAVMERCTMAALDYAARQQNHPNGFYKKNPMTPNTEDAVIMLASLNYESRDCTPTGIFGASEAGSKLARTTIDDMLRLGKVWRV